MLAIGEDLPTIKGKSIFIFPSKDIRTVTKLHTTKPDHHSSYCQQKHLCMAVQYCPPEVDAGALAQQPHMQLALLQAAESQKLQSRTMAFELNTKTFKKGLHGRGRSWPFDLDGIRCAAKDRSGLHALCYFENIQHITAIGPSVSASCTISRKEARALLYPF